MLMRLSAAVVALSLLVGSAAAQSPVLSLDGKVKQPQRWTLDDLKKCRRNTPMFRTRPIAAW